MDRQRIGQLSHVQLTRRTALKLSGVLGAMGVFGSRDFEGAIAQSSGDPLGYPELAITATEYSFDLPPTAEAGWTHVRLDNQGMMDHHAMFLRPQEGKSIDDIGAALESGDFTALVAAAVSLGGPIAGPMHQASVAMNLEAGQYMVICLVPNDEGVPHVALGMLANLEVTEGSASASSPEADATINLVDMAFDGLPSDVNAGSHVWEIKNKGTQIHEMVILKLAQGVSIDQAMQMLTEPPAEASPVASPSVDQNVASPAAGAAQGPPFEAIGGLAPMSPEQTAYAVLDATPGDYITVCFVPDAKTGVPHFAMGMIASFTVT